MRSGLDHIGGGHAPEAWRRWCRADAERVVGSSRRCRCSRRSPATTSSAGAAAGSHLRSVDNSVSTSASPPHARPTSRRDSTGRHRRVCGGTKMGPASRCVKDRIMAAAAEAMATGMKLRGRRSKSNSTASSAAIGVANVAPPPARPATNRVLRPLPSADMRVVEPTARPS